jgi:hypothetical protein
MGLFLVFPTPAVVFKEPTIGGSKKVDKDWTIRDHRKQWASLNGLKQAKTLIQGPSTNKAKELLKLSRIQLRWVIKTVHSALSPKRYLPNWDL